MALERVTFNCLIIHIYLVCTIKNDIKECQIENPKEIQLQTVIAHSHGLATSCLWHRTIFANTPDLVDHIQMKLMGSSAQISSGACRCGSQGQVPEGSGEFRRVLV